MSETINENEQWKLKGDCSKCRRRAHCQKACTAKKRHGQRVQNALVHSIIDRMFAPFGGGYY